MTDKPKAEQQASVIDRLKGEWRKAEGCEK